MKSIYVRIIANISGNVNRVMVGRRVLVFTLTVPSGKCYTCSSYGSLQGGSGCRSGR